MEQMQAGDPVVGAPMAVAGAQSRSEDEESLGVRDVKRTATQAFGSGVPKRRSSSRFDIQCILLEFEVNIYVLFNAQIHILFCFTLVHLHMSKELYVFSFRSIKRKKFDDELVESSLVKSSSRVKGPPVIEPVRCPGSEPSSSEKKKVHKTTQSKDSLRI